MALADFFADTSELATPSPIATQPLARISLEAADRESYGLLGG